VKLFLVIICKIDPVVSTKTFILSARMPNISHFENIFNRYRFEIKIYLLHPVYITFENTNSTYAITYKIKYWILFSQYIFSGH
jgi:hypothetical protein